MADSKQCIRCYRLMVKDGDSFVCKCGFVEPIEKPVGDAITSTDNTLVRKKKE